jgi:energy-coupling factor transporter transmembrane protein EcfT
MRPSPAADLGHAQFAPAARARRLPPIALALAAQGLAALIVLASPLQQPWPALLVQGVIAAVLGHRTGLPRWWLPINLVFAPAALWLHGLALAPEWFLAIFALLALLFWTTFRTRVPLFLSSGEACARLQGLLPVRPGLRVIDLGCGFGDVLRGLAPGRPDASFVGAELAPLPALIAWLRTRKLPNARVERRDFWNTRLGAYDVVYAFLSPAAMPDLWRKARSEMKRGSLLISNSFAIPGVEPHLVVPLSGRGSSALYVWRL